MRTLNIPVTTWLWWYSCTLAKVLARRLVHSLRCPYGRRELALYWKFSIGIELLSMAPHLKLPEIQGWWLLPGLWDDILRPIDEDCAILFWYSYSCFRWVVITTEGGISSKLSLPSTCRRCGIVSIQVCGVQGRPHSRQAVVLALALVTTAMFGRHLWAGLRTISRVGQVEQECLCSGALSAGCDTSVQVSGVKGCHLYYLLVTS